MKLKTQAAPPWKTAVPACVLVLALAISFSTAWRCRDLPHLGDLQDDTLYLLGAKSLLDGSGYRISSLPGAPYQTKYPPVYSLLLTPIWLMNPGFPAEPGNAWLWLWLMAPCFVLVSYALFRRSGLSPPAGLMLAALVALNPYITYFSVTPMTELALGALAIGICALVERKTGYGWIALAGILAGLAFLLRAAALPLLIAVPLWLILSRRGVRSAVLFAGCMAPAILGWSFWSASHRMPALDQVDLYYTDYLGLYKANFAFGDLPRMLWINLYTMLSGAGSLLFFDVSESNFAKVLLIVLAAGAIAGIVRLVRAGGWTPYILFAAFSAPMLVLWNFQPNERFLAGFTPLLLLGAYTELRHFAGALRKGLASERRSDRITARAMAAVIVLVLAFGCWRDVWGTAGHFPKVMESARGALRNRREVWAETSRITPANATFVCGRDVLHHLYTGRRAYSMFPPPTALMYRGDAREMEGFFLGIRGFARRHALDYVLLSPEDGRPLLSGEGYEKVVNSLKSDPSWELLLQRDSTYLFHDRGAVVR